MLSRTTLLARRLGALSATNSNGASLIRLNNNHLLIARRGMAGLELPPAYRERQLDPEPISSYVVYDPSYKGSYKGPLPELYDLDPSLHSAPDHYPDVSFTYLLVAFSAMGLFLYGVYNAPDFLGLPTNGPPRTAEAATHALNLFRAERRVAIDWILEARKEELARRGEQQQS